MTTTQTTETSPANRPVCESADDAFLPTGTNPELCSDACPVHGTDREER